MTWFDSWRRLAGRIQGLTGATNTLLATFQVDRSDPANIVRNTILPELQQLNNGLREFHSTYGDLLPPLAAQALASYLERSSTTVQAIPGQEVRSLQTVVPLSVFCSEFEYLLRDVEAEARTLTELAFEHLRRMIEVDQATRSRWTDAFDSRETDCEKLGAVHLLSHGIWAFKVSGGGAATDLVFPDQSLEEETRMIRATARVLVLTEWKLVKDVRKVEAKAKEARTQAQRYSRSLLADLELKTTRYVVLVTKRQLEAPVDLVDGPVTYRHIVLPTAPEVPSTEARRK